MYYQYDAQGHFLRKYTRAQALALPPEVAVHLKAVTDHKPTTLVSLVDAGAVGLYHFVVGGSTPSDLGGYDPIDDLANDVEGVVNDVADTAKSAADTALSIGDKLFNTGEQLLDDLGDLFEYAPYIVLAIGAAAVVYTVRPMFAGSSRK